MSFYIGMTEKPYIKSTAICIEAAIWDVLMLVLAFWAIAAISRCRRWVSSADTKMIAAYSATAFVLAMGLEIVAVRVLKRYSYAPQMPIIPFLKVGITPFLQWLVLPPVVVQIASRGSGPTKR